MGPFSVGRCCYRKCAEVAYYAVPIGRFRDAYGRRLLVFGLLQAAAERLEALDVGLTEALA
ncbi:MAG: hypothetical protein ACJA0P_001821 [Planctomycetota bacterium]|jgi:hypothetical protein